MVSVERTNLYLVEGEEYGHRYDQEEEEEDQDGEESQRDVTVCETLLVT